jgi:hypothetical protein
VLSIEKFIARLHVNRGQNGCKRTGSTVEKGRDFTINLEGGKCKDKTINGFIVFSTFVLSFSLRIQDRSVYVEVDAIVVSI